MRAGIASLPDRMRKLPLDARGYPVPYFVQWFDGVPDFRVVDPAKWQACIRFHRCWICGDFLGKWKTFVFGPKSAAAQISAEPPSHFKCAEFAVKVCPFMILPKAKHRGVPDRADVETLTAIDPHNPGRFCLWTTSTYGVFDSGPKTGALIRVGDAYEQIWYVEGERETAPT